MTTKLDKTLKREIAIKQRPYILTLTPEGLKLTAKGRRKGIELKWLELVSGEAALAVALNASLQMVGAGPASEERKEAGRKEGDRKEGDRKESDSRGRGRARPQNRRTKKAPGRATKSSKA